jgi:hypothetical protein
MTILNFLWSLLLCLAPSHERTVAPEDPLSRFTAPEAASDAVGEAEFERLLALYDTLPFGLAKDQLGDRIDAVAGQRYATVSRLYWHRDLEEAKARARAAGKPILSLRMLGRLDEELSCANSRFFRVVLYANHDVSAYLREHYVLHWSTERPVPKVTIDMGDGRVIETTLAGNSAHYVLDCDGRAIDVLPGLYAPVAFLRALEEAAPVAIVSPRLDDAERATFVHEHFVRSADAATRAWNAGPLVPADAASAAGPPIATAERLTISKLRVETPVLDALAGIAPPADVPIALRRVSDARLDAKSLELIARLRPLDWTRERDTLPRRGLDALTRTFESAIARDTQQNELILRPKARALFFRDGELLDLPAINAAVYSEVFKTPASDPWLGLANPLVFSALPNDGLVTR